VNFHRMALCASLALVAACSSAPSAPGVASAEPPGDALVDARCPGDAVPIPTDDSSTTTDSSADSDSGPSVASNDDDGGNPEASPTPAQSGATRRRPRRFSCRSSRHL
jgi:hypothetical protein